jgi:Domain of unknown function (DUF4296)
MRQFVLIGWLLLLLTACADNRRIPSTIMPPEKFQAVLTDVLLADGLTLERSFKDTAVKISDENAAYFLKVFQLHGVSKNDFMKSYNFYLQRPDLLKIITDSVSSTLDKRNLQLSIDTAKPKPNGNNFKKTGIGNGNK